MAKYFPIFLNLEGMRCLVVGGGEVAKRKIENLLGTGAKIVCVSIAFCDSLLSLLKENNIIYYKRPFEISDLDDADIVFAATDNEQLNKEIYNECEKRKILVNVVDSPSLCRFIVPSVVQRGDLQIAISTSGKYPSLSQKIRRDLEELHGESYAAYLELLDTMRQKIMEKYPESEVRKKKICELLQLDLLELIDKGETEQAEKLASTVLD